MHHHSHFGDVLRHSPGVIAFVKDSQIFTMDSQGESIVQITHTVGVNNDQPVISVVQACCHCW